MFELIDNASFIVPGTMLILARISGMFLTFPIFSASAIGNELKIAIIAMFTLLIAPNYYTEYPEINSIYTLLILVVKELFIGFTMGYGTKFIFETFNIAGSFIGRQIGLSMSETIDPNTDIQTPLISQFFTQIMLIYLLVSNGHYLFIETFYNNFKIIPLGTGVFPAAIGRNLIRTGSNAFVLALHFAGPTIVFMLLVEAAVAIAVRVMPEMNAFFITLPLRIACGIFSIINSLNIFQLMYSTFYEHIYQYIGNSIYQMKGI